MDPTVQINERIEVIATYHVLDNDRLICFPRKMKFRGQEIEFTVFGMRHPTSKGKRMIHVFEMSDGVNDYRIEFDAERLTWTLVNMLEGRYVRPA
jgi:hypothetical protein